MYANHAKSDYPPFSRWGPQNLRVRVLDMTKRLAVLGFVFPGYFHTFWAGIYVGKKLYFYWWLQQ